MLEGNGEIDGLAKAKRHHIRRTKIWADKMKSRRKCFIRLACLVLSGASEDGSGAALRVLLDCIIRLYCWMDSA
jgi:hypothetical protein